ncbi:histone H1-like [Osmia lignaria lignaria]|uniref:histone H1-like n=1 Tax=Osmia lignaria lignaria TaxID=1437193 RepID=UPI00402BD565
MEEKNSSGNTAAVENAGTNPSPAKKSAKSKIKSQRSKSSHPPTAEMVNAAIKALQDRKGSSVQAIKKYIATTYKVDGEKMAPFIKKYLKAAVTTGAVVQTKGKGASGSFKLSISSKGLESKSKSKRSVKKTVPAVAEKKAAEKKPASPKKAAAPKKAPAVKKSAAAAKKQPPSPKKAKTAAVKKAESAKQKAPPPPKNLSKTKKATKAPAAKTKTPKPKTAKSPKVARAAAKK